MSIAIIESSECLTRRLHLRLRFRFVALANSCFVFVFDVPSRRQQVSRGVGRNCAL